MTTSFEALCSKNSSKGKIFEVVAFRPVQRSPIDKWIDGEGMRHNIEQHEGREQGPSQSVAVQEETKLWEALGWVPDVQCAGQILLQCAGPRCHHFLRTVPPGPSATNANSHDAGMWTATETVLGRLPGSVEQDSKMSRDIANAPRRPRSTIGNQDGPSRILGILGRCFLHDLCASSLVGRGDLGGHDRRAGRRLHRRVGVCCRAVGSRRFSATTRLIGCSCEQEPAHQWLLMPNLANGSMAGSFTRPLLLNTISERPCCSPGHAQTTMWRICVRTQAQVPAMSCAVLLPNQNSLSNHISSAPS